MVRCTWDRSDSQVAEQTAHPTAVRAGDRVFSSNACTQIDQEPELVRRVIRVWVVRDEKNPTGYRLSTQAFEDHRQTGTPCSVAVRRLARSLDESMNLFPEHSFALVGAGFVQSA